MKSRTSGYLFLLLGVALGAAALLEPTNQKDRGKSKSAKDVMPAKRLGNTTCRVTADDPTWAEPATYYPANNQTVVTLCVREVVSTIGKDRVRHRSYNGGLVGPVIRTRPGHKLRIHLVNDLPVTAVDIAPAPNQADKQAVEVPHGFNTTNLHTHGLHVSPKEPSDNVFLQIDPLVKKEYKYTFCIPADHPAGTFWYHAHKHGSVAVQLTNGMAGALIVEGGLDDYEGLRGVKERIMVFQQMDYRVLPGRPALLFAQDIYTGLTLPDPAPPKTTTTLINGQLTPIITMRPGEIQRWRMIHAGLKSSIYVHLEEHQLTEIAYDGIPLKRMRPTTYSELNPGYRVDVLVKASLTPGTYCIYNEVSDPARALRGMTVTPQPLAKIVVEGPKCDMPMPDPAKMTAWVTDLINTKHPQLKDIDAKERTGKRALTFYQQGPWKFFIDDKTFNEHRQPADQVIQLGAVEEWTLRSKADKHPFHIHVNPFQVQVPYPDGKTDWVWRDTILISDKDKQPTTIRSRFLDFDGKTVLHCHNLDHEDQGMMQTVDIQKKAAAAPTRPAKRARGMPRLPWAAPDWSLEATDGRRFRRQSFEGRHLLLVFHRGLDCLHCSEQLSALAKAAPQFSALGVEVAAISPQWPPEAEVRAASKRLGIGFPLLADPTLSVFRDHGCYENEPLHALFLIDVDGQIRWQAVTEQPVTDTRGLLDLVRSHVAARERADLRLPVVSRR
jgi:FtsP/CotA-like multicopper oxidase with cupredoxin domain/peroxiredoxin